jgi:hypothetical protein
MDERLDLCQKPCSGPLEGLGAVLVAIGIGVVNEQRTN